MKPWKKSGAAAQAAQLRDANRHPFGALERYVPLGGGEEALYHTMREALPVLDAAVCKLVRLTGGFAVRCGDSRDQAALEQFLRTVPVGRAQRGIDSFLAAYLDSLLLYGRAVGELVVSGGRLAAVCWGDVTQVTVQEGDTPLEFALCGWDGSQMRPLPYQNLLLFTTLNPEPGHPYGVSLFRSMPFLSDVLLKIYKTMGVNWERAGNLRYSVVCRTAGDGDAGQRAQQMAEQWSRAMRDTTAVRDFVAVGDVDIKVIGADGPILDSEVPVRQILEQLVAKTGLPPFLLGFSWASTERMSAQQADLLTAELWAIRRAVQPVLERVCETWLRLEGREPRAEILWDEITLQDIEAEAHAELYRAQARRIEEEGQ